MGPGVARAQEMLLEPGRGSVFFLPPLGKSPFPWLRTAAAAPDWTQGGAGLPRSAGSRSPTLSVLMLRLRPGAPLDEGPGLCLLVGILPGQRAPGCSLLTSLPASVGDGH